MRHQEEILSQRLIHAQSTIKRVCECLSAVQKILEGEEFPNRLEIASKEIEEIRNVLHWVNLR